MPRMIFTVNAEMETDLREEAKKRGASLSNLARLYIAQGLAADTGKPVDTYAVTVGGDRTGKADKKGAGK